MSIDLDARRPASDPEPVPPTAPLDVTTAPLHPTPPTNAAPVNPPAPPAGPAFPPPPPAAKPRRQGPGWLAVIAVGAGGAVVSSVLTAGLLNGRNTTAAGTSGNAPAAAVAAPVSAGSASSPAWAAVAKAVEPSVVAVTVSSRNGSGEGSGVILDTAGNIVTNNHVVAGAQNGTVTVTLHDGRAYPASVVGTDPATDLAVISIDKPPSGLRPAVLGDSATVATGNPVMAVGNPLGLAGTVTTGIVSSVNRPVSTGTGQSGSGEAVVTNAIQTDAAVNPGNSGGALVDAQGRVIGIPSSIASLGASAGPFGQSSQSGSIGLGFAIPVNEVKDVTAQLLADGTVEHAWLGVAPTDGTVTVDGAAREAAVVQRVIADSPAQRAGLQPGDAVIAVNGTSVNSAESLVGNLRQQSADSKVQLTIVRDGSTRQVQVTLATRPDVQQ